MDGARPPALRFLGLQAALGAPAGPRDLLLARGQVQPADARPAGEVRHLDMSDCCVLPGLVNAHDHLDVASLPPLGSPPHSDFYAWTACAEGQHDVARAGLAVPLVERLFLGGLRNLLAGTTAVLHHGAYHRALGRADFPVRVQARYQFALAPRLTPHLRRCYRSSDRRIPFVVHAGEGRGPELRAELEALAAANVLRHNTVVVQPLAFGTAEAERLAGAGACAVWQPEAAERLYGVQPDLDALLAAGVRLGLGSDAATTGARDALSNLGAVRRLAAGRWSDDQLLELATSGSAGVARLPCGGLEPGAPADLLVCDSRAALLAGERGSVVLVVVAGRPLYGRPELLSAAGVACESLRVDGRERALARALARRARALFAAHPALRRASWAAGLEWGAFRT